MSGGNGYLRCIISGIIGAALAFAYFLYFPPEHGPHSDEVHEGQYELINPLLFCDSGERISETNSSTQIKKSALEAIAKAQAQESDIEISVYYRNLNNGPWFGINETVKFIPSSLLKVQALLAALKEVERNPDFMSKKIQYEGSDVVTEQYYKPTNSIEPHKTYSVQELLEYMIRYSDNNAALLIAQLLGKGKIDATFHDIGIDIPPQETSDFMSVKAYSAFFRVLYNASYLRRDLSEDALALLSQTDFSRALAAGVPSEIVVAHKFGERVADDHNLKQLHDCGIIYHPTQPYILCIMTRGSDFDTLSNVIKSISTEVWNTVEQTD